MVSPYNAACRVLGSVGQRVARKKSLAREAVQLSTSQLARVLTVWDLTALGVGSTLGIGIYVLAGAVAKTQAGPAVILSFLIAAVASFLAGLCYAEFGARVPSCGSAYMYCYVCIGEGVAFLMGWNLILEFLLSTSSVARGYSGYVDQLLGSPMRQYFKLTLGMETSYLASYPDLLALALVLALTCILLCGAKESTRFNNLFTICNLLVVVYVIICGAFKADTHNWNIQPDEIPGQWRSTAGNGGFFPFGLSGVVAGAATCFFGFQGFDAIPVASEEAKNPKRAVPLSICLCLVIVFFAYFGVASVLTLMWPYYLQDPDVPLPYVFEQVDWPVAKWVISIGTLFGLSTSLIGALYPLPRIVYSMANDGLLFHFLAFINYSTHTPTRATVISGVFAGLFACLFELQDLVDLMSLSTLFAFALVAACVIVLRYQPETEVDPELESSEVTGLLAGAPGRSQAVLGLSQSNAASFSSTTRSSAVTSSAGPTVETSRQAVYLTVLFTILSVALSICVALTKESLAKQEAWAITIAVTLASAMLLSLYALALLPQAQTNFSFKVPLVPLLPALNIMINVYLMVSMRPITWIQYSIYMALGLIIYAAYGWRHSSEEPGRKTGL